MEDAAEQSLDSFRQQLNIIDSSSYLELARLRNEVAALSIQRRTVIEYDGTQQQQVGTHLVHECWWNVFAPFTTL